MVDYSLRCGWCGQLGWDHRLDNPVAVLTPRDKYRAGHPVEVVDKLATITSIAELEGFKDQWRKDGKTFTENELAMIARFKTELLRLPRR